MKTKSEVFLTIDVFIGTVPVTEISTLDPGYISTTAGTEILGGTVFEKYNCWKITIFIKIYSFIKLIATDKKEKGRKYVEEETSDKRQRMDPTSYFFAPRSLTIVL